MRAAVRAGSVYFLLLFALGFLLALLRVPFIAPAIGETFAVLLEIPVMLAAAWAICRGILKRIAVPASSRLLMGAAFLVQLLAAEVMLGVGLGSSALQVVQQWAHVPGSLGLSAQVLSALFPRIQVAR